MAGKRSEQICLSATPWYHLCSRVVRRLFFVARKNLLKKHLVSSLWPIYSQSKLVLMPLRLITIFSVHGCMLSDSRIKVIIEFTLFSQH